MNSRNYSRHGSAARGTYGSQPSRRQQPKKTPSKKKKLSRPIIFLRSALIVLVLLLSAVVYMLTSTKPEPEAVIEEARTNATFLSGITVNGVDVSGKTYDEAKTLLANKLQQDVIDYKLSVQLGELSWSANNGELSLTNDLEAKLSEAIAAGRTGTPSENSEQKRKIEEEGLAVSVEYTASEDAVEQFIRAIADEVSTPAVEPHAVATGNSGDFPFEFTEGTNGLEADTEKLLADITARVSSLDPAPITLATISTPPDTSIDELKQVTKQIATFNTSFKGGSADNKDRVHNIEKAADIINGAMIKPGEEFSFNGYVGPRSEKGGWALAPGIINGREYVLQAGGGICQVSTTLYNALLMSDVQVVSRKKHTWPSSYVPIGLDATVSTDGPDLIFKNNKDYPIYIIARADTKGKKMHITIYGPPLKEGLSYKLRSVTTETIDPAEPKYIDDATLPMGETTEVVKPRSGYKVEVYRDQYMNGELIKTELLYKDSYRAIQGEYAVGTGAGADVLPNASQAPVIDDGSNDVEAPVPGATN